MEVLSDVDCLLSNVEVLSFLREQRSKQVSMAKRSKTGNVATLMLETITYLEQTKAKSIKEEKVKEFLKEMEKFRLEKSELLMLLNHCPTSDVEIHLLVEDSEERITNEQVEEILEIVQR